MKRFVALAALLMMAGWTQAQAPATTAPAGQTLNAPAVAGKPLPHHKKVAGKKIAKKGRAAHKTGKANKLSKHGKKSGKKPASRLAKSSAKSAAVTHHHAVKAGRPAAHPAVQ